MRVFWRYMNHLNLWFAVSSSLSLKRMFHPTLEHSNFVLRDLAIVHIDFFRCVIGDTTSPLVVLKKLIPKTKCHFKMTLITRHLNDLASLMSDNPAEPVLPR